MILVVEDELLLRWAIVESLRDHGFEVVEASTGAEALTALGPFPPSKLGILLDLRLPDVDDLSLAQTLRERHPDALLIMMSAHSTAEVRARALSLGVDRFLEKPFDVSVLAAMLQR
jgi:DNA-binding response OmpR family regulator